MRSISIPFAALMLSACSTFKNAPEPAHSEYLHTLGSGFVITLVRGEPASVHYEVNLATSKDLPDNSYAVVSFENPADKTRPFLVEGTTEEVRKIYPSRFTNFFALKSPPVKGLVRDTRYAVVVSVYGDSSKQTLVTRHVQLVDSDAIQN